MKECIHSITHSLTHHVPSDSSEDWVTIFVVLINFETLTSTKTGFCEIPPHYSLNGGRRQKQVSMHDTVNNTVNYLMMKKLLIAVRHQF